MLTLRIFNLDFFLLWSTMSGRGGFSQWCKRKISKCNFHIVTVSWQAMAWHVTPDKTKGRSSMFIL
jgi:hypothetical protein